MTGFGTARTVIVLAGVLASGATVLGTVAPGAEAATQRSEPTPVVAGTSPDRTLRDPALRRPTGLAVDPTRPTTVFTVDGSRRSLRLVVVAATGRTKARWTLRGATARHVTDIALGLGRQVWIGDIGDAARARSEIKVFRTRRPAKVSNRSVAWSAFRLRYPDGHHDAQALLVNPVSGRLFVVTRDARGGAVYEAPARLRVHAASRLRKVASAPRGVTGGEYARTGRQLALTHGDAVTVYSSFGHPSTVLTLPAGADPGYVAFERPSAGALLVGARKRRATLLRVRLPSTSQGAATTPAAAAPGMATLMAQLGWRAVQEPRPDSITLLDPSEVPASPAPLHAGPLIRTELRDGETVTTSGYTAHRAEVYGRNPVGTWSGTPSSQWPDPPGSTRWYDFSMYMPADFPLATDSRWFDFTQWKGYRGGSPPVALEIKRNELRLGGSRTSQSLGVVNRGGWTHFTVGIHFSTSASDGWVEVYRNGRPALPRLSMSTLDVVNGQADPIYLKQGIYRSNVWHVTQVLYYSPMQVTTTNPLLG